MGVFNGCVLSFHSVPPDLHVVVYYVAIAAGGEKVWDTGTTCGCGIRTQLILMRSNINISVSICSV